MLQKQPALHNLTTVMLQKHPTLHHYTPVMLQKQPALHHYTTVIPSSQVDRQGHRQKHKTHPVHTNISAGVHA